MNSLYRADFELKNGSLLCIGDDKNKGEKRVIANWGDTLWSLADEHHVRADDIRRSNNLPMVLPFTLTASSTPSYSGFAYENGLRHVEEISVMDKSTISSINRLNLYIFSCLKLWISEESCWCSLDLKCLLISRKMT